MWLVGPVLVAAQPRVLALFFNVSIGGLLRLCNYYAAMGRRPAVAATSKARDVGGPPKTRVVSITVQRVSILRLAVSDIAVRRSDGATASFRRLSLLLWWRQRHQHQQRQRSGQEEEGGGQGYPDNGHWKPVVLRLDGVRIAVPPPPTTTPMSTEKTGGTRVEEASVGPCQGRAKKAILLPAAGIWVARLMAVEVGDLRIEESAMPASTVSSDQPPRSKNPDDGNSCGGAGGGVGVRSLKLKGLRFVGLFSASSSRMSVSLGGMMTRFALACKGGS